MSATGQHFARLSVQLGERVYEYPVLDCTVTIDEERAPYIEADLTHPIGDGALLFVDPTDSVIWVDLTLRRVAGRVDRIRDLTRRYRDRLLSFITAQFDGGRLADITRTLYHDYETPGAGREDNVRTFRLMMRSLDIDRAADTIRMTLTSGEGALMDHELMDTNGRRIQGTDLNAKVASLVAQGTGFTLAHPATDTPLDADIADEAVWSTGQSAWDCLQSLTRTHGYQVWCDEYGDFHLAETRPVPPLVALYAGDRDSRSIINIVERRTRDQDWYTAVLVKYDFGDEPGYDVAVLNPNGPHKARQITVDREGNRVSVSTGRAQATLNTIAGRHRAFEVLAVNDYTLTPGGDAVIDTPRDVNRGHISSIRWQLPSDQMSIRLRDMEEVA